MHTKNEPVRLTGSGSGHYGLIVALSEILPENSTLIIPDVTSLSDESNAAVSLAQRFLDRHISLEFQNSPWLNTKKWISFSRLIHMKPELPSAHC